jgi:hypothetical protein
MQFRSAKGDVHDVELYLSVCGVFDDDVHGVRTPTGGLKQEE